MESIRITDPADVRFGEGWEIYRTCFPLHEQRTPEHQNVAMRSPQFSFRLWLDAGQVVGVMGYWEFERYLYIEHYAVTAARRGSGYGSRILGDLIRSTDKCVIVEIEEICDELTERRWKFYKKLGFVMNPYLHSLPQYRPDGEHREARLHILTYPGAIDRALYDRFARDQRQIVMRRE